MKQNVNNNFWLKLKLIYSNIKKKEEPKQRGFTRWRFGVARTLSFGIITGVQKDAYMIYWETEDFGNKSYNCCGAHSYYDKVIMTLEVQVNYWKRKKELTWYVTIWWHLLRVIKMFFVVLLSFSIMVVTTLHSTPINCQAGNDI